jgi:hypothetical protein
MSDTAILTCIPATALCYPADSIAAIAAVVTTILTFLIVLTAWYQLSSADLNQRKWATLQACDRYDSDPEISKAARIFYRLANPRDDYWWYLPEAIGELEVEGVTLLNYFDSISIGVLGELYIGRMVYDHLYNIMQNRIEFVLSGSVPQLERLRLCLSDDFTTMMYLHRWWKDGYRDVDISDFKQYRAYMTKS